MRSVLGVLVFLAAIALGFGPWVALPAALLIGLSERGPFSDRRKRRRRRDRGVRHGFQGTLEVWDLRGVVIRLDVHGLEISSHSRGRRELTVHEIDRIEVVGNEILVKEIDGEVWRAGRARAGDAPIADALEAIRAGIAVRRRGSLEDKRRMEEELQAALPRT